MEGYKPRLRKKYDETVISLLREQFGYPNAMQVPRLQKIVINLSMKDAIQKMDRRQMEETLPQLQQQNKDMLQQLDRSMELLKQLREEERMEALARRAEDLKAKQDELNREHAMPPGKTPDGKTDPKAGAKSDPKDSPPAEAKDSASNESQSSDSKSEKSEKSEPKADPKGGKPSLAERQKQAAEQTRELAQSARDAAKKAEQPDTQQLRP